MSVKTLPLTNALLLQTTIEEKIDSDESAKLIAFIGPSGVGKSCAGLYCAVHCNARVIPPPFAHNESALLAVLLEKLNLYDRVAGKYINGRRNMSMHDKTMLVVDYLAQSNQPLVIDEAGIMSDAQLSLLRLIADRTATVFVLIGEGNEGRTRRCDNLDIRLDRIYNLKRRCSVVYTQQSTAEDVVALADSVGVTLPDDYPALLAGADPADICRNLVAIKEHLSLGGKLDEKFLNEVM